MGIEREIALLFRQGVSPPAGGDQRRCLWKLQAFEKSLTKTFWEQQPTVIIR
ncbi:MAG: hypothetical protein MJ175_03620 [Clostridia bacterium]|nr:hypothetical protein [Clostridia bacterium]